MSFFNKTDKTESYATVETVNTLAAEAEGTFLKRSEAETYVSALDARLTTLRTEGVRELEALQRRVSALETLANSLRGQTQASRPVREGVGQSTPVAGVDYAAVAFGLSEIKSKIKDQFHVTDGQMSTEWSGTVQYFADVFTKADPQFDADTFKRQSGV